MLGAGVDIVQLREKGLEAREELALLEVFAAACRRHGALLAVNDRADVALAAGADVLHLGQDDLPVPVARRILGPGRSSAAAATARTRPTAAAAEHGVDYFCAGPVWATPTKPGRPATGPGLLAHVARAAPGPAVVRDRRHQPGPARARCSRPGPPGWSWSGRSPRRTIRPRRRGPSPAGWPPQVIAPVRFSRLGRATMRQMRIAGVESTDLFVGTAQRPLQVVRVTLVNEGPGCSPPRRTAATVHVDGPGVRGRRAVRHHRSEPGERRAFEVPVEITAPYQPGSTRRVTVAVTAAAGQTPRTEADITVAEPGWTMWMVSHFHYDPVWWNTQGQFTEARLLLPDEDGALPDVRTAFELVSAAPGQGQDGPRLQVRAGRDRLPEAVFRRLSRRTGRTCGRCWPTGRVEIVGGNYNEPSTNLTCAESTIRNAVYGIGFQRDVFGGDPRSAWMLDVFGHDPGYPGLMAAAGLTSSSWARGPFHQWGPAGAEGGIGRMQFRSEFEWLSPDGGGLLTAYMAHHYGAGWTLHTLPDLAGRRARGLRAVPRAGAGRGDPRTSCCRSAPTTSSRPAG